MNFDGIKAITIPEGSVKKIECAGKVLWEKAPKLVCRPTISITISSKIGPTGSPPRVNYVFDCSISGISRDLISSVDLVMTYYYVAPSGIDRPMSSLINKAIADTVDTTRKYLFSMSTSYSTQNARYYGHSFALQLKYIDLDGNEKTLTTNSISSAGASANASA